MHGTILLDLTSSFNMVNPCSHLKLEQPKSLSLVELVSVRRQLRTCTCMHMNVHGSLQE